MAYSDRDWAIVKSYFESGVTLDDIVANPKVKIRSKSQISKKANKEGWKKETGKKQLVEKETLAKQALNECEKSKETFTAVEIIVHNDLVEHKLALVGAIKVFSTKAMRKAGHLLEAAETGTELKAIVEAVDKLSITNNINERHAKAATINNTVQNANLGGLTTDDIRRRLREIDERVVSTQ